LEHPNASKLGAAFEAFARGDIAGFRSFFAPRSSGM
jgi:hypothetical protein